MKKSNLIAIGIALVLFIVPFFWLKPGFVDLGGDAGRLYFIDPLAGVRSLYSNPTLFGASTYAFIPYELYLYVVKKIVVSPTYLIAFNRGILLFLAFFSIYLIVRKLLFLSGELRSKSVEWISLTGAVVYISFITQNGWVASLETLNQIFLNPLIFYLLLQFVLTSQFRYGLFVLFFTLLYSGNFGYSDMPQMLSFYPLAITFLFMVIRFVFHRSIQWANVLALALLFLGLHSFHLLPMVITVLDKGSSLHANIFSEQSIQYAGVAYFDQNRQALGKISTALFQPSATHGQNLLVLLIPGMFLLGMLRKPSKLISVLGIFFAVTLFLVSANITQIGAALYGKLFYIPGFLMFRSFNEKWYYVYVFFYSLLFALALYELVRQKKLWVTMLVGLTIIVSITYRIAPFLQGKAIDVPLHQSKNVSGVFTVDPDLLDTLSFVRALPVDGKVLTLPLTFPYYQIAYGKEGGAYVGVSTVLYVSGRPDFPGFWSFGPYSDFVFDALHDAKMDRFVQLLSLLNIRYIFYNSDTRIIDNFPSYPSTNVGDRYSSREQLPVVIDQGAHKKLLTRLNTRKIYEKGFFSVHEIDNALVRPLIYIPDDVADSREKALEGSPRSAFLDKDACEKIFCTGLETQRAPSVSYEKRSVGLYDVTIDFTGVKTPFLLILSDSYDSAWELSFEETGKHVVLDHVVANGYANGWIIDPVKTDERSMLQGRIYLTSMNYLYTGIFISGLTIAVVIFFVVGTFIWRRNEKH